MKKITDHLNELKDEEYKGFQSQLIPTVDEVKVIGVRTPALRTYAKELIKAGEYDAFLNELPHEYFDENQLHSMILSELKGYDDAINYTQSFLQYIDNWATCDQLSPKSFKKNKDRLLPCIQEWIQSDKVYTIRFGIKMLMQHFLDDDYDPKYPEMVAGVRSDEYYVNMMIAWYFATALSKQYELALPYLKEQRLSPWVHNKAIQKSVESYRISEEQKVRLKALTIRQNNPR